MPPSATRSFRFDPFLLAMFLMVFLLAACVRVDAPVTTVVPDRPGYTDTPTVLPTGTVQLEAGYTDDRSSTAAYRSIGETLLRIGLGGSLEARLFGNSYGIASAGGATQARGLEDSKIGAKLALIVVPDSVHGWTPSLAVLGATTLPTGAPGIGRGATQPEVKLAASWTTPTPVSLFVNAGINHTVTGADPSTQAWESVATWYAAAPRLSLYIEAMHLRTFGSSAQPGDYADLGLTFLLARQLQVDVRAGRALPGSPSSDRYVGVGLARRW